MFLSVDQVAERLSARGKPVRRKQVYQWVNVGVKVRSSGRSGNGGGERVRLRCTRLPGGMVFLERDLDEFVQRLNAAWANAGADRVDHGAGPTPMRAPRRADGQDAPGPVPVVRQGGFARCAPSEVGTYPELARGAKRVSGGGVRGGRLAGRRAAAPVAGTH